MSIEAFVIDGLDRIASSYKISSWSDINFIKSIDVYLRNHHIHNGCKFWISTYENRSTKLIVHENSLTKIFAYAVLKCAQSISIRYHIRDSATDLDGQQF